MVAPLFLILAAAGAAAALPPAPPGYELIPELSDEFDGDTLDPAKWSTDRSVIITDFVAAARH